MIFRYLGRLALVADILIFLYIVMMLVSPAGAQMKHHEYHPEWLRKSWCCGKHDTCKVRVAFLPPGRWHVVWIDNPPGYPAIRLLRPIPFDAVKMLRSQDGEWWASFQIKDGVATGFWFKNVGGELRPCIFGRDSGQ